MTVIVAVAVFPVAFTAYKELYVNPLLSKYPEPLRPFIDPNPFFATTYGYIPVLAWTGLGIFWLVAAAIRMRAHHYF